MGKSIVRGEELVSPSIELPKRYQVFVSSTYEDLLDERKEVMQVLLELDCIPAGMELFPAADEASWTLIKKVIDDSDYYMVIVGGRYGSVGDEGKSFTQMEFEYAAARQKPIIAFIHGKPGSIPADKSERSVEGQRALEDFKNLLRKRNCKSWTTAEGLAAVAGRSIVHLIREKPAVGWVRADAIESLERANAAGTKAIESLNQQMAKLEEALRVSEESRPRDVEFLHKRISDLENSLRQQRQSEQYDVVRQEQRPINAGNSVDVRSAHQPKIPAVRHENPGLQLRSVRERLGLTMRDLSQPAQNSPRNSTMRHT